MFYDDRFDVTNTVDMCDALLEKRENGSANEFEEALLFYLCGACDLVYDASTLDLDGLDYSEESWKTAIDTICISHMFNIHTGMDEEESKAFLFAKLAGYFLFTLYNTLLENGNNPELFLNEMSGNIILFGEKEDGRIVEYDVLQKVEEFADNTIFESDENSTSFSVPIEVFLDGFKMAFAV